MHTSRIVLELRYLLLEKVNKLIFSDPIVLCSLPKPAAKFIEMCLMVTADHGPAVSGAHNTIVCARAGKDLISSLTSGLLTIVSIVCQMKRLAASKLASRSYFLSVSVS